jgi:hypothetical protein
MLVGLDRAEIDRHFEFADRFKPQFPSKPHPKISSKREIYRVVVSG